VDRRSFIAAMGALAVGMPRSARAGQRRCPAGVQLYTVRDLLARDFEGTLAAVAQIGYGEVEFAGYHGRTPRQVRAALSAAGLQAPSAHVGVDALTTDLDQTVETAAEVGHQYLFLPWIPEEMRTMEGYRRLVDTLNHAGERAMRSGLRVGYHNQEYDFRPIDGQVPYELVLHGTDERVRHELDVYWAAHAGADPAAYLTRYRGSFAAVHLKDMTRGREMTDVGRGSLDFPRILDAADAAGIRHCFVEHDSPASPLDSIRAGYAYLSRLEGHS
jgi:sugar phosphate isomerase/epimerase